jgi:hypothetical protein
LRSAPVEADDEPLPGAAVSERWEQANGGLVAALRYAVLTRPSPSKPAEEWWRTSACAWVAADLGSGRVIGPPRRDGGYAKLLGVRGVPTNVHVDSTGTVRACGGGNPDELYAGVDELLRS